MSMMEMSPSVVLMGLRLYRHHHHKTTTVMKGLHCHQGQSMVVKSLHCHCHTPPTLPVGHCVPTMVEKDLPPPLPPPGPSVVALWLNRREGPLSSSLSSWGSHGSEETIHGDIRTIHGGDRTIHGDNVTIHGDIRTICGDIKTIHGDISTIHVGDGTIHDDIRTIHGDIETIHGDIRTIHGDIRTIQGGDRTIHGDNVTIHGNIVTIHGNNDSSFSSSSSFSSYWATHATTMELLQLCMATATSPSLPSQEIKIHMEDGDDDNDDSNDNYDNDKGPVWIMPDNTAATLAMLLDLPAIFYVKPKPATTTVTTLDIPLLTNPLLPSWTLVDLHGHKLLCRSGLMAHAPVRPGTAGTTGSTRWQRPKGERRVRLSPGYGRSPEAADPRAVAVPLRPFLLTLRPQPFPCGHSC